MAPFSGVEATAPAPAHVTHRRARGAGWSLVAAGSLCEVAAIVLQSMASRVQSELDSHPLDDLRRPDWLKSGSRDANWALGMAIAGGALVAGGASVLIVNLHTDPGVPQTTVVGLAGTF